MPEDLQRAIDELKKIRAEFDMVDSDLIEPMCKKLKAAEDHLDAVIAKHKAQFAINTAS